MSYPAGVDISYWQSTTPSLAGQSFLIARATYQTFPDRRYAMHTANADRAGLVIGAYHFGVNSMYASLGAQVDAFLAAADDARFLILDLERDGARTSMTNQQGAGFIATLRTADSKHRKIGLYHSASSFPSIGQDFNHVARWGTTAPSTNWTFWQWQGSPLDRNYFNGTAAQLKAFGLPVTTPHYRATVIHPTNLWNDGTRKWVYNGANVLRAGKVFIIRGAQYQKGGQATYPITYPYPGYFVPVANVQLGGIVP